MTKTRDLADLGGGFIQAGTGAVQRTVESKLQDVVSVKDFGAVGDGVTDDTSKIQAALNAAEGKTLYFPKSPGSYLLNSSVSLPSGGVSTLMDPGVTFSGVGSTFTRVFQVPSLSVGPNGTEIARHLSATALLNFGLVPASYSSELTVTVPGASLGDTCVATPNLPFFGGVTWCAYCVAADTVTIRVVNAATSDQDIDGPGGSTWRVDVWQH